MGEPNSTLGRELHGIHHMHNNKPEEINRDLVAHDREQGDRSRGGARSFQQKVREERVDHVTKEDLVAELGGQEDGDEEVRKSATPYGKVLGELNTNFITLLESGEAHKKDTGAPLTSASKGKENSVYTVSTNADHQASGGVDRSRVFAESREDENKWGSYQFKFAAGELHEVQVQQVKERRAAKQMTSMKGSRKSASRSGGGNDPHTGKRRKEVYYSEVGALEEGQKLQKLTRIHQEDTSGIDVSKGDKRDVNCFFFQRDSLNRVEEKAGQVHLAEEGNIIVTTSSNRVKVADPNRPQIIR
ncbi:hypothetical protein LIER_05024 [Lithospermum erythrorhizon]|uniref:Uncharacterized protein n=1 Tax=Lithospermum erythrorhizon TaxID=34254 RepID=A0AAV3P071_LITER